MTQNVKKLNCENLIKSGRNQSWPFNLIQVEQCNLLYYQNDYCSSWHFHCLTFSLIANCRSFTAWKFHWLSSSNFMNYSMSQYKFWFVEIWNCSLRQKCLFWQISNRILTCYLCWIFPYILFLWLLFCWI